MAKDNCIQEKDRESLNDAYSLFLRSIQNLRPLSAEENRQLLKEYHEHPEDELRNEIVSGNRGLVISTANKFVENIPNINRKHSVALDLYQEGSLALIDAVNGFRIESGTLFSTFASSCIKNKLISYRQNKLPQIKAPSNIQRIIKEVNKVKKEYAKTNTSTPSDEEIIKRSNGTVTANDLDRMAEFYSKSIPISREKTIADDDEAPTIADTQRDDTNPLPDKFSEDKEKFIHLKEAIDSLDEREKDIFLSFFGFGGKKVTLESLGKKYNVSTERIRQLKEKALKDVRDYLAKFD